MIDRSINLAREFPRCCDLQGLNAALLRSEPFPVPVGSHPWKTLPGCAGAAMETFAGRYFCALTDVLRAGIIRIMVIHSIPEIGNVLRNAVLFNFKNPPEAIMNADSLLAQVERLFRLLDERKTDYVLVGGIALLTYVEGRNTQDIDLIMASPALAKLPEIKISSQDMYFARGQFGELQIDVLLTQNPVFDRVAKKYSTLKKFLDREIRCATVEGLILLKLFELPSLYRQGSFERVGIYENDLSVLIYNFHPDMEPLLKELNGYMNDTDMAEARQIIKDIEARIWKFRKANE